MAAEKMLNLVHTTASMQRANGDDVDYGTGGSEEFFGDEDDDEEEPMDIGGEEGPSSRSSMPSWAFSKNYDEHHFKSTLFHIIQQTQTALQATTNASTKKLLQAHLNPLQLHQIQSLQHNLDVTLIKTEIDQVKKDVSERLDAKFPNTTVLDINRQLRKNYNLATKVDSLDTRLEAVEASLTAIHLHQAQQTQLLQKLVAAQTLTSTQLDANKKGEKDSLVPVSQGEPITDKLDSKSNIKKLDVAAVEKELDDKWKKIDEEIIRKFGPIEKPDKTFHHHSQVKQISVNEMSLGSLEKGQPSCIKSPKANLVDLMFETPSPDLQKCFTRQSEDYKERVLHLFPNQHLQNGIASPTSNRTKNGQPHGLQGGV
ncbi:hypothetical protein AgCh_033423 [Apium graveolens]